MIVVAFGLWVYLNVEASMSVKTVDSDIQLPASLTGKINVNNHLKVSAAGFFDTKINMDQMVNIPLRGKYLANVKYIGTVPVTLDVDHWTKVRIDQIYTLNTTTDLVYQNRFLPKFPLKLDIPIKIDVPFHLKKVFHVPIYVIYEGPVHFSLNEDIQLNIKHQFTPRIKLHDDLVLQNIAPFNATMENQTRDTKANLTLNIQMPLKNIHP